MIDVETYAAAKAYTDAHGGGGGGTTNYNALDNKPQIAGTTLQGNKTLNDLGIAGEDAIEDVYAVMGEMGAKNLIPYPYYSTTQEVSGIMATDNGDGTITLNGTASANASVFRYLNNDAGIEIPLERRKYKLTFGTDQGSSGFHLGDMRLEKTDGTSQVVNVTGDTIIDNTDGNYLGISAMGVYVAKTKVINNVTIYPMLRLASDTDDTYQQYAKTNKQLTDEIANKVDKEVGKGLSTNDYDDAEKGKVDDNTSAIEAIVNEYGAKNLLPNNATSQTISGVTFTVNADGSVTANGTATDNTFFNLSNKDFGNEAIGTYLNMPKEANGFIISDGIVGEHEQFCGIGYDPNNNNVIFILIMSGYTANNLTFYPMLRDARIKDPTYVPYAMTNRELTDAINAVDEVMYDFNQTPVGYNSSGTIFMFRYGRMVILRFVDYIPKCPNGYIELLSGLVPAKFEVSTVLVHGEPQETYIPFKVYVQNNKLYSYYNVDMTSNTVSFLGELVYFTD